jgi:hypothetical protein
MAVKKIKLISVALLLAMAIFAFLGDSNELLAKKSKKKSSKKSGTNCEQQVQRKKEERIKKLYDFFPIYEEWEKSEIYPYNDFTFLSNFDRHSIYESFEKRKLLISRINDWLGVRYSLPGRSRRGIDCSNFVSVITQEALNLKIPAGAATQATLFHKIEKREHLQFGDFIFFSGFDNRRSKKIGHVGIYIGNGLFAHSATNHGVIYTHISEGYYTERFRCGGRIIRTDLALLSKNN